ARAMVATGMARRVVRPAAWTAISRVASRAAVATSAPPVAARRAMSAARCSAREYRGVTCRSSSRSARVVARCTSPNSRRRTTAIRRSFAYMIRRVGMATTILRLITGSAPFVILSEAKDLLLINSRSFASLRMTRMLLLARRPSTPRRLIGPDFPGIELFRARQHLVARLVEIGGWLALITQRIDVVDAECIV